MASYETWNIKSKFLMTFDSISYIFILSEAVLIKKYHILLFKS